MKLIKYIATCIQAILGTVILWDIFMNGADIVHSAALYFTWVLVIHGILYNIDRFVKWTNKEG